jgi:hypothetical protein
VGHCFGAILSLSTYLEQNLNPYDVDFRVFSVDQALIVFQGLYCDEGFSYWSSLKMNFATTMMILRRTQL